MMTSTGIDVSNSSTRNFEGFETSLKLDSAPTVEDEFGRTFIPERMIILHYAAGHWGAPSGNFTEVSLAGGLAGNDRISTSRTWNTGSLRQNHLLTAMPEWVREIFVQYSGLGEI